MFQELKSYYGNYSQIIIYIIFLKNTKATTRVAFMIFNVGMARFELATSSSQTRRDNRATLHPERKTICMGLLGAP